MCDKEQIIQIVCGQGRHGDSEMYALTNFGRTLWRDGNGSHDRPFRWLSHLPAIEGKSNAR